MSRPFAKKFYKSKAWQQCREAYFVSKNGLCELCNNAGEEVHHKIYLTPNNIYDINVTLNWDNLQLLCKTCHNAVHEKAAEIRRYNNLLRSVTSGDSMFDVDGNLIENRNVFIVWGAPSSGKTMYVKENMNKHDIVIDLDYIRRALHLLDSRAISKDSVPFALDIRDLLYDLISRRKHKFDRCWITATLPNKTERMQLKNRLNAELIHINTSKDICLEYAKADDERRDKTLEYEVIEKYFKILEL